MSNRELVIDLVSNMPEDAPLADIIEKIAFIQGVQEALDESERGEGIPAKQFEAEVKAWASKSS